MSKNSKIPIIAPSVLPKTPIKPIQIKYSKTQKFKEQPPPPGHSQITKFFFQKNITRLPTAAITVDLDVWAHLFNWSDNWICRLNYRSVAVISLSSTPAYPKESNSGGSGRCILINACKTPTSQPTTLTWRQALSGQTRWFTNVDSKQLLCVQGLTFYSDMLDVYVLMWRV